MTKRRPALFVGHDVYRQAGYGGNHPLAIARVGPVMDLCRALGWLEGDSYRESPRATHEQLLQFHAADYVEAVRAGVASRRHGLGTMENPLFPGLFERAATSVGGSILAGVRAAGVPRDPQQVALAEQGLTKEDDLLQSVTLARLRGWLRHAGFRLLREDRHVTGFFRRVVPGPVLRRLERTPWAQDVMVGSTNASLFAYVADGRNGLRVLQLVSANQTPGAFGFSPRPVPSLIASYKTHGPALSVSKGLDRDRAVDESGNQVAVFGRRGGRHGRPVRRRGRARRRLGAATRRRTDVAPTRRPPRRGGDRQAHGHRDGHHPPGPDDRRPHPRPPAVRARRLLDRGRVPLVELRRGGLLPVGDRRRVRVRRLGRGRAGAIDVLATVPRAADRWRLSRTLGARSHPSGSELCLKKFRRRVAACARQTPEPAGNC